MPLSCAIQDLLARYSLMRTTSAVTYSELCYGAENSNLDVGQGFEYVFKVTATVIRYFSKEFILDELYFTKNFELDVTSRLQVGIPILSREVEYIV